MPRIRSEIRSYSASETSELVRSLVKALQDDEDQADGPVIFEVQMGSTEYLEVVVVWDLWDDLPADWRSRIVLEAYEQAAQKGFDVVDKNHITTVIPVTVEQALEMGLLPYQIYSNVSKTDATYDDVVEAMKKLGAIETRLGTELRLPSLQLAREVRDRLKDKFQTNVPGIYWEIKRDFGRNIDD